MAQLTLVSNPRSRKRRTKRRASTAVARRRRPVARVTRRRRNPARRIGLAPIMQSLGDGAIGAAGAVGTEALLARLPVPEALKHGVAGAITNAVAAIAVGAMAHKFGGRAGKRIGTNIAQGGTAIALHKAVRETAGPALGLGGYADYGSGLMGYYGDGLGYTSPGTTFVDPNNIYNDGGMAGFYSGGMAPHVPDIPSDDYDM